MFFIVSFPGVALAIASFPWAKRGVVHDFPADPTRWVLSPDEKTRHQAKKSTTSTTDRRQKRVPE